MIKKIRLIPLIFLLAQSCNSKKEEKITQFQQLFGQQLQCEVANVKTTLFFYSPHMIGIPIYEDGFEHEYFQSVGSKKETNSLYYETSFKASSNYKTKRSDFSKDSKRLRITIKDEEIFVTAIHKLDEKNIPVNPVLYRCRLMNPIQFN